MAAKQPPLRWGLLSTAHINRALIPAIRASRRSRLVAVASRTAESADTYARKWGISTAHASYEALLADPNVDVIYIPLPNHLHTEWAVKAMHAGKHVLIEKPLALTVEDVQRIIQASAETGMVAAEAFMYRHHPQTLKVHKLLVEGAIGEVRLIRGVYTFHLIRPEHYRWTPEAGGGSLWDVGCYPISFARMVMGMAPSQVQGWQQQADSGVDLTFTGQMTYPIGAFAQVMSSYGTAFSQSVEIIGAEGRILISRPFSPVMQWTRFTLEQGKRTRHIITAPAYLYSGEVADMEQSVLDGGTPRIPLSESLDNISTIIDLYKSAIK